MLTLSSLLVPHEWADGKGGVDISVAHGAKLSMEKHLDRGGSSTPLLMIFTDLDGTLLDHHTYGAEEAREALELCRKRNIPIVPVSSKTRAEIEILRRRLRLGDPFIVENGGGIYLPDETFRALKKPPPARFEGGLWKISLGRDYRQLVNGLHDIAQELGWKIRGFSDMNIQEIGRLTGLDQETCRSAAMREYDEPFLVIDPKDPPVEPLLKAAAERGFFITRGGRFLHIQGENDKGAAMAKLLSWYGKSHGEVLSVALGDSPNDFSMLEKADYPVLIRSSHEYPDLKRRVPRLKVTRGEGPRGWNEAVLELLG